MIKLQQELGMVADKGVCIRMAVCARAKLFIAAVALLAATCFVVGATHWQSKDPLHFLCYLAVATMASA
jgi:hypothetical protein